jgi:hypothetical protein
VIHAGTAVAPTRTVARPARTRISMPGLLGCGASRREGRLTRTAPKCAASASRECHNAKPSEAAHGRSSAIKVV